MEKEWIEYPSTSGDTMFLYNKVTGEHKWPNGSGKGKESKIKYERPEENTKYSTIGVQTDDDGRNNQCMSMYIKTDPSYVSNKSSTQDRGSVLPHTENSLSGSRTVPMNSLIKKEPRDNQEEVKRSEIITAGPNGLGKTNSHYNDNGAHSKNISGDTNNIKLKLKNVPEIIRTLEDIVFALENSLSSNSSDDDDDENCHENDTGPSHVTNTSDAPLRQHQPVAPHKEITLRSRNDDEKRSQKHDIIIVDDNPDVGSHDRNDKVMHKRNGDENDDDCDNDDGFGGGGGDDDVESDKEYNITVIDDNGRDANDDKNGIRKEYDVIIVDDIDDDDGKKHQDIAVLVVDDIDNSDDHQPSVAENNAQRAIGYNCANDVPRALDKNNEKNGNRKHRHSSTHKKYSKTKASLESQFIKHTSNNSKHSKEKFKRQSSLNAHRTTEPCSYCKEVFTAESTLVTHMKTHTKEKPFRCFVCQKKFDFKGDMVKHLRHAAEKPFQCAICKTRFSQKSQVNKHMRTHIGLKQHECSVCKKKASQKSDLKRHMRTHNGEKPYECSVCKTKFSQKSTLTTHMKTHTGEKSVKCSVCRKSFSRQRYLKSHMRIHTGEKPFECSVCKKTFTFDSNLKSHMRTHTGEKPFQCLVCKKKFSHKNGMNKHFRIHTREAMI